MADRITGTLTIKPKETLTDANAGEWDVTAGEVGVEFKNTFSFAVTDFGGTDSIQGYLNAAAFYREAIDSADTTDISSEIAAKFVLIINTGFTYSSSTVLGIALDKSIKVMSGTTSLGVYKKGEPFYLGDDNGGIDCTGLHVRTVDNNGSDNASAGHLAVEFLVQN